jgi:hypothetical protein
MQVTATGTLLLPIGELFDEGVGVRGSCGGNDFLVGGADAAVTDVVRDRAREQYRLL